MKYTNWNKKLSASSVQTQLNADGSLQILSSDFGTSSVYVPGTASEGSFRVRYRSAANYPQIHLGRTPETNNCVVIYINSGAGQIIAANYNGSLSQIASDTITQYNINKSYTVDVSWDMPWLKVEVLDGDTVVADFITRNASYGNRYTEIALGAGGNITVDDYTVLAPRLLGVLQLWGDSQMRIRPGVSSLVALPQLLRDAYRDESVLVFDRAIDGENTQGILDRIALQNQTPSEAQGMSVLLVGGNDIRNGNSVSATWTNLLSCINELQSRSQAVAVCTYPLRAPVDTAMVLENQKYTQLNDLIRSNAAVEGYTVLDIASVLWNDANDAPYPDVLLSDNLHLSSAGHAVVASEIMSWVSRW